MIQAYDELESGVLADGQFFEYNMESLNDYYVKYKDQPLSTWKTRHTLVRGILGFKPVVRFESTSDKIVVSYPTLTTYVKDLKGLLQFKEDYRTLSSQYDTFAIRREFVGCKLAQDCQSYIGTTEAFTVPNILSLKAGFSWAEIMKLANWDALNDPTSWIEEVQLMNQIILDHQFRNVSILSDHLPEVPVFDTYRCIPNAGFTYKKSVILMSGNCCVGKTSLILSEELPILLKEETDFRNYLEGVIASDDFKVKLRGWFFDELDHKGVKFEGLVHLHSMAITDLIMNKSSSLGLSTILDGRFLCEEEISRVFNLGKWANFGHVVISIDGDTEDLIERSKTRKCPRIEESVIRSGQYAARNSRCTLLNTGYSVYFFKTLGYGANIRRVFAAECHRGYFQVWHRYYIEEIIPCQNVAHNNALALAQSQHELG